MKILLCAFGAVLLLLLLLICSQFGWSRGCSDDERIAMQEIFDSMGYQSETSVPGIYTDDCCQWEGVDCSLTSSHVVRILFYYVREEEELWYPDMNSFAQIKGLQELHLSGNRIGGLENKEALCTLHDLQQLDLSDNLIEDDLPSCLANMSSLRILRLSKNQFQGGLTSFGNLSNIEEIDVSYNLFQGMVPLSTFANLSKLRHLDLSYNHLLEVESESPTWHPTFQIQHLFLAGCNLNNRSCNLIPHFLSTQSNLQTLDLSNNFLKEPFPSWLLQNVSSVLRLRGNSFVGEFPYFYQKLKLVELDISCNLFDRQFIPSNISIFLPNLYAFNASSSGFAGTIPPSLGELKSLQHLDLSSNKFLGGIPHGLTKNSALWYLNLSNNSLSGELLPRDCNMPQLRTLLLHHNLFVGNMPTCLSNSQSLLLLDVRNNNLSGVISDRMPIFPELGALLLRGNYLSGYIPSKLCQMKKLQFLDLSNNEFSSSIPSCLKNNLFWTQKLQAGFNWVPTDFTTKGQSYSYQGIPLTLMSGIDLSANKLTGTIPDQLGELKELHSLNLSNNVLTGHFPTSFINLENLESLDLSHNILTGKILLELSRMSSLSTFHVAYNDLSGRIPFDEQLSTFSESSYIGNPNLCGEPLERKCSENSNHQVNIEEEEEEEEEEEHQAIDEPLFFYSFVFVSYAFGFWSVILPLCLSRNWRRKYYGVIDEWMDR